MIVRGHFSLQGTDILATKHRMLASVRPQYRSQPILVVCMGGRRALSVRCNNVAEYQQEEAEYRQRAPSRAQGLE